MAEFNRTLSFICLLAAFLSWMSLLVLDGIISGWREKVSTSISLVVYLNEQISGSDIQDLKGVLDNYDEVYVKKFINSEEVYEALIKDPAVSKQLELIGDDFVFPASFELGIKNLESLKFKNIVKQLEKHEKVQFVEIPSELIEKAAVFFKKSDRVKKAAGWIAFLLGIFLFWIAGYLYFLSHSEKISIGKDLGVKNIRLAWPGMKIQFFNGMVTGLLSAAIIYGIIFFLNININFSFLNLSLFITGAGFFSALFYFFNVVLIEL